MLKKYLDDALLFEQKGYKLYTKLAAEAKNELSQKLFASLADQELSHINAIKAFVSKAEVKKVHFDPLEMELKKIYQKLGKAMLGKDLSQVAGLEEAMQMEKDGYELYLKAHNQAEAKADKTFLEYLLKMESEHYEALANLYYYYTSNDQWLSEEEAKVWNWMNL